MQTAKNYYVPCRIISRMWRPVKFMRWPRPPQLSFGDYVIYPSPKFTRNGTETRIRLYDYFVHLLLIIKVIYGYIFDADLRGGR